MKGVNTLFFVLTGQKDHCYQVYLNQSVCTKKE